MHEIDLLADQSSTGSALAKMSRAILEVTSKDVPLIDVSAAQNCLITAVI